jgi:sugar phosphate isomerase/epimerase
MALLAEQYKTEDLSRLCVHTQTTRPWNLFQCTEHYARAGIRGISVWRHLLEGISLVQARRQLNDHHMEVVSLVRGGFFASADAASRKRSIENNLKAVGEAEAIGAPLLVLVCGADPRQSQSASREQIGEGISAILPRAEEAGIRLAMEPLHPMYAADRSAITTIGLANDMVEEIGSTLLGIAVDVFHLWWDPLLQDEIRRCGKMGKLFAFHISDWKPGMSDMLNDRGLMGEGCIDLKLIRSWMAESGFNGYLEVEVFSEKYWSMDQEAYLEMIKQAYLEHA